MFESDIQGYFYEPKYNVVKLRQYVEEEKASAS